jgi:type I restriction enzyme S subunit
MGDEGTGMWELPEGWEWRRLGKEDVAEIVMGQSPPGKTYNDKGKGLPFFQGKADFGVLHPSPRKWCTAPKKVAEPGDVLISVRAPVGPTNLCAETCCIGRGLAAIRPSPRADSKFLLFALRARESEIARRGQGSTFAAITKHDLVDFQIPVPPLDEQRRIVACIEELFARIEEARRLRAAADQDAERLMPAALEEVFEEAETKGWPIRTVGDVIEGKPQYGTSQKASEEPVGVPVLRMGNIVDGQVSFDDLKYIDLPPVEEAKYILHEGDLLFNRTNSAELVGKSAVYPGSRRTVFASYLIRIVADRRKAMPHFVAAYINSPLGRQYIQSQLTRAIGQVNVNAKKLQAMPIPVPPLPEQRHIVEYLDGVQAQVAELKRLQVESAVELERFSGAVLARAFRGEL